MDSSSARAERASCAEVPGIGFVICAYEHGVFKQSYTPAAQSPGRLAQLESCHVPVLDKPLSKAALVENSQTIRDA